MSFVKFKSHRYKVLLALHLFNPLFFIGTSYYKVTVWSENPDTAERWHAAYHIFTQFQVHLFLSVYRWNFNLTKLSFVKLNSRHYNRMKGLQSFIGTMIFYILLSYVIMPLAFFYFVEKSLMSAGNGFVVGSVLSVMLWFIFRSSIIWIPVRLKFKIHHQISRRTFILTKLKFR